MMNIIFAGTPEFSAQALRAIVAAGFHVSLVLTQPDRPKGRGMQLQKSAVKEAAEALGLPIAQPTSLKNEEAQALIAAQNADVMVVAAYGLLLPQAVLDLPKHGCWNIHASLLPRWRGAAPIQRAIEAGDNETGICIMQMDAGLDTGDIISAHHLTITPNETAATLHDRLATLGAQAIVADLQHLQQGQPISRTPQPTDGVTYAHKLNKAEAEINWQHNAADIERRIRAFNPVPAAWCMIDGKPAKIWAAEIIQQESPNTPAGTVLALNSNGLTIACKDGALQITELQPAGSKRMTAAAFATGAGRCLKIGQLLAEQTS